MQPAYSGRLEARKRVPGSGSRRWRPGENKTDDLGRTTPAGTGAEGRGSLRNSRRAPPANQGERRSVLLREEMAAPNAGPAAVVPKCVLLRPPGRVGILPRTIRHSRDRSDSDSLRRARGGESFLLGWWVHQLVPVRHRGAEQFCVEILVPARVLARHDHLGPDVALGHFHSHR